MNLFALIPGSSRVTTLNHHARLPLLVGFLLAGTSLFAAARSPSAQQPAPFYGNATKNEQAASAVGAASTNETATPASTNAPATSAVTARALPVATAMEIKAYDFLKTAALNYQDVSVDHVTELFTVGAIGGPQVAAGLIVQYAAFPDVEQFDDGTFGPLTVGIVPGHPEIPSTKVASVTAAMASMLDNADTLVWADWTGTEIGHFSTVIALNANAVKFDTFVSNMPGTWPPLPGSHGFFGSFTPIAAFIDDNAELKITNLFGCMALVQATIVSQCLNGKVLTCTTNDYIDTEPLWEGRVSRDCKTIANPDGTKTECCYCEVSLGAASGFKSLEVEAGGIKLKVTGALGCGFTLNTPIQKCCAAGGGE